MLRTELVVLVERLHAVVPSRVTIPMNTTSTRRRNQRRRRTLHATPPSPNMPGSRIAQATGLLPLPGRAGRTTWVVTCSCVSSSIELTGGQADTGDPEGQLAGVVGRISTDSGVKVHDASLGRPEHESVTNMGDVRAVLSSGTTVTAMVPDPPQ